jgi:hypothetical protein
MHSKKIVKFEIRKKRLMVRLLMPIVWVFLLISEQGYGAFPGSQMIREGLSGQKAPGSPDTLKKHTILADLPRYHMLDLGIDYLNNTDLYGQFNSFSIQPAWSASAILTTKCGLDGSLLSMIIENSDTTYQKSSYETDIQAGYQVSFLKFFSFRPSFAYFIHSANSSSIKAYYSSQVEADLSYDFKWFTGKLSALYLQGESNVFFLSLQHNFSIELNDVFARGNVLFIMPGAELNFSDQQFYNETLLHTVSRYPRWFLYLKLKYPHLQWADIILEEQRFVPTSLGLNLPITYMAGPISFNFTISAYKPLNQPYFIDSNWTWMYDAGISYTFVWGEKARGRRR